MTKTVLERAREVFDTEIEGLQAVRDNLNGSFEELVARCMETLSNEGKLIFTGIGKSGYIGKKIAATLSSVGSPSVFMHPVEARHGDLGMITKDDVVIGISYSGETGELLTIVPVIKRDRGSDPASVCYDVLDEADKRGSDLVLIDRKSVV